jgi:hypothetical protein
MPNLPESMAEFRHPDGVFAGLHRLQIWLFSSAFSIAALQHLLLGDQRIY